MKEILYPILMNTTLKNLVECQNQDFKKCRKWGLKNANYCRKVVLKKCVFCRRGALKMWKKCRTENFINSKVV